MVDIEIPPASQDFAELLAHEMEHVTEFIDRVDFKALVEARDGGVVQFGLAGGFESTRAQQAGRTAAAEVDLASGSGDASHHHPPPRPAPALPITRWRD
jgi:hypothetical protein